MPIGILQALMIGAYQLPRLHTLHLQASPLTAIPAVLGAVMERVEHEKKQMQRELEYMEFARSDHVVAAQGFGYLELLGLCCSILDK